MEDDSTYIKIKSIQNSVIFATILKNTSSKNASTFGKNIKHT